MEVDLACAIPNNVGLADKPQLLALLQSFDRQYRDWWAATGPLATRAASVYLRTPIGVNAEGWASYAQRPLSEYRWGVFQTPARADKRVLFGARAGQPVWQDVPDEHRPYLMHHLVIQGDTEPGSVEQARRLAAIAPSLYDLRNLVQFSVEEGRHLWAMVHLLYEYFGAQGRDEAEHLLARRSGDATAPRLLDAFNEPIDDWLSHFLWCFLADRDGKYQLLSVAESAFDPLARSAQFMLTEEAHHMFIGEDGLRRVVERTLQLMRELDRDDIGAAGGIPLATIQRYINQWAPRIHDLFGNDQSRRVAEAFDAGLRSRAHESGFAEHQRLDEPVTIERPTRTGIDQVRLPAREVLNAVARQQWSAEVKVLLTRLNRIIERAGVSFALRLPSERFNRRFGPFAGAAYTPEGEPLNANLDGASGSPFLPTDTDRDLLRAVMQPVLEPGRIAGWIAPPARGINSLPALDYDYVRF